MTIEHNSFMLGYIAYIKCTMPKNHKLIVVKNGNATTLETRPKYLIEHIIDFLLCRGV